MKIIDFHTHAFPDALAERAVPALAQASGVTPALDGKVSSLLRSMDRAGIAASVICSIATKPAQFQRIYDWSLAIRSDRIIPFPSVHPADPDAPAQVRAIAAAGFKGVKLHPYYQEFDLDEPRVFPIYEAVRECGLILVSHTGYDIAYPRTDRCGPARVLNVIELFPDMKFVATHMGAWEDWTNVEAHITGRPVYMEMSFSMAYLGDEKTAQLLLAHSADHVLFGSDSPWADQQTEVERARRLPIPEDFRNKLLYQNAARLLGLAVSN